MARVLFTDELRELAGTGTPVFCNAGGGLYRGEILGQISFSRPPSDSDGFSFHGTRVGRPSESISWNGRQGDFFAED